MNRKRILTAKQKMFCEKYIELGNKVEAYRQSYSSKNMNNTTINGCVGELFRNPLITTYISELQKDIKEAFDHTINESLRMDMELIEKYNSKIKILENPESTEREVEAAKRTMKFIGIQAFNGAMERIAKKMGFYEKDNHQKAPPIVNEIDMSKVTTDTLKALHAAYKKPGADGQA